jgi:hypothetical protein
MLSQEQQHIFDLFQEKAKNDANSVTLANTLNKDIEMEGSTQ